MRRIVCVVVVAVGCVCGGASPASAQPFGTFRWQQQPYCNVIQVDLVAQGGLYKLDGFDDQCGAATRAAATGLAFPNPDGSIGFGLTIVTTPGSVPVHLTARLVLPSISGTWASGGQAGAWTFVAGAGTGGAPRPVPPPFTITGGFSVNGGVISNLGAPAAAGDATSKGYVDGQNAGDRAYADAQGTAARSYADSQDAVVRTYARSLETTPVMTTMYASRILNGYTTPTGCVGADIDLGLSVSQGLPVPDTATLTAVRALYVRGIALSGALTITVNAVDFATGSPVTTMLASRSVTALSNTYISDVITLPIPLQMSATKRVYVSAISASTVNTSSFCGAAPVYTMP